MVDGVRPGPPLLRPGLTRCGVETTYYDPLIGDGIERLMRPNTKVVYSSRPAR